MKKRYEEIEIPLKEEFKNRFLNEQWMDMDDFVPIIPTELSMYGNDDGKGFIISNFDVERNRRSFIKDFYIDKCGYTQIKTNSNSLELVQMERCIFTKTQVCGSSNSYCKNYNQ